MGGRIRSLLAFGSILLTGGVLIVDGAAALAGDKTVGADAVRAAIVKSIPQLENGARGSMEQRSQCFTCHNQGVPIVALTAARSRGFAIDGEHLQEQLEFTAEFLGRNREKYREGKGTGGAADTAGYALLTLERGAWRPDATTSAVAEYLLVHSRSLDHWRPAGTTRPPTQLSPFTTSYLALVGLKTYSTPEQRERVDRRFDQVGGWLRKATPKDNEDRVFRLLSLPVVGASYEDIQSACRDLIETQRSDGGWAQLAEMESDAYATGTALFALHQAGGMPVDDSTYRRGLSYLLTTQKEDGTWHVATRAKPIQQYFESGYPHGKDQFISIAAAGWATTALAFTLPIVERDDVRPRSPALPHE